MQLSFPDINCKLGTHDSCKSLPKFIVNQTCRTWKTNKKEIEKEVRNIRMTFHYMIRLRDPILKALAGDCMSVEEVWDKIGISDCFLGEANKKLFIAITCALLYRLEDEGCVERDGTRWKLTDDEFDCLT